jgi:uncharacterized protein YjiS (DUF1127 family)
LRPIKPDILLAGIALHGPAAKTGSIAMVQILMFDRQGGRTGSQNRRGGFGAWAEAARQLIQEMGRAIQRIRMEAELRRKLEGVDDHLLRDMGLKRTGDQLESTEPGRSLWGGTGV